VGTGGVRRGSTVGDWTRNADAEAWSGFGGVGNENTIRRAREILSNTQESHRLKGLREKPASSRQRGYEDDKGANKYQAHIQGWAMFQGRLGD